MMKLAFLRSVLNVSALVLLLIVAVLICLHIPCLLHLLLIVLLEYVSVLEETSRSAMLNRLIADVDHSLRNMILTEQLYI
uniref:Putative secreted protein n=1 Tax=Xenopsylla cheopis TaxID=163159 RepID=A0A6M2DVW5_XENCH